MLLKLFWRKIFKQKILEDDQIIGRFILDKSQFSKQNDNVKYTAFIPPKKYPTEISVFNITSLNEDTIWNLGENQVAVIRKKNLLARANLTVCDVNLIETEDHNKYLKVIEEKKPHPLHANIQSIPIDDAKRLLVAKKLAIISKLYLKV